MNETNVCAPALIARDLFRLRLPALPLFLILLVKGEELGFVDKIQVQGSARRHNGTDLEPVPDGLKRPCAGVGFPPAFRQLMTGNKEFCRDLIAEAFGVVVAVSRMDELVL